MKLKRRPEMERLNDVVLYEYGVLAFILFAAYLFFVIIFLYGRRLRGGCFLLGLRYLCKSSGY